MWKVTAAMALVPVFALSGQGTGPSPQPFEAEIVQMAQVSELDSLENMDMLKARALQSYAISSQTYAFVATR